MTKHTSDNLRIKRKYLVWRKDSKGLSDASVDKSAAAVSVYQAFLNGKDFRSFHSERARSFKRHLSSQQNQRNGSKLSDSTINGTLRGLVLSRIRAAPSARLGHLTFECQGAFPSQC